MKKILAVLLLGLLSLEAKIIGQGELADYGLVFTDGIAVDKDGNIKAVGKNFMVTGSFSDGLCVVFIGEQTFLWTKTADSPCVWRPVRALKPALPRG